MIHADVDITICIKELDGVLHDFKLFIRSRQFFFINLLLGFEQMR